MARLLPHHLVAGLQWETLIGLEKESAEVKALAASRVATHYAIADDGAGTRAVGLGSLPVVAESANQMVPERYALASVIGLMIDAPNVVFLCPDPEDAEQVVVIVLHDRRPEKDVVLSWAEAAAVAHQFVVSMEGAVHIVGFGLPAGGLSAVAGTTINNSDADVLPRPLNLSRTLTFDDVADYLRQERPSDCCLRLVRRPLPVRKMLIGASIFAGVSLFCGGAWWGWEAWQEAEREKLAAANRVDPVTAYRNRLKVALAQQPFVDGATFAEVVQQTIQALPVSAGGWRPESIVCKRGVCEVQWMRQEGGTFDKLLAQRPAVSIVDINSATESIVLPSLEEFDDTVRATPVPLNQFYRTAGARLQQLGDYGMDITMTTAEPLLAMPPAARNVPDLASPVAMGKWQMGGHLAFLDSIAGLVQRAGNMTLDEVQIAINDEKPVFTAQGAFYVH